MIVPLTSLPIDTQVHARVDRTLRGWTESELRGYAESFWLKDADGIPTLPPCVLDHVVALRLGIEVVKVEVEYDNSPYHA